MLWRLTTRIKYWYGDLQLYRVYAWHSAVHHIKARTNQEAKSPKDEKYDRQKGNTVMFNRSPGGGHMQTNDTTNHTRILARKSSRARLYSFGVK